MSDRWLEYFRNSGALDRDWLKVAVSHWHYNHPLYQQIIKFLKPGSKILDIGCGHGFSDIYLASRGYKVVGVDNDERIVAVASEFAARVESLAEFAKADAFDLKPFHGEFDLAYSCGVLEHFDREVTIRLLREQERCASMVLIEIPTKYTAYTGEITDERIYSIGELKRIVEAAGLEVVASFGYGDVCATRSQIWFKRLMPYGLYRWLQNRGFAYGIAVIGKRQG